MKKAKHIESAWLKYVDMVIPAGAGPGQISETRKAFYSGATVMFYHVMAFGEEEYKSQLDAIDDEIALFLAQKPGMNLTMN